MPTHKFLPDFDILKMPLRSLGKMIADPSPQAAFSLSLSLVQMANTGRFDALAMLFGVAYLYRDDLEKMKLIVNSIKMLDHPEAVKFLRNELLRVPSSPATRTYLRAVLDSLFSIGTSDSIDALHELMEDPRIGTGYKRQIESFLLD